MNPMNFNKVNKLNTPSPKMFPSSNFVILGTCDQLYRSNYAPIWYLFMQGDGKITVQQYCVFADEESQNIENFIQPFVIRNNEFYYILL